MPEDMRNGELANSIKALSALLAGIWARLDATMQTLVYLMVLDIFSGLLAAFVKREVSSSVSFPGMAKKAIVLVLVVSADVAGRFTETQFPLGTVVAGFYCGHELISIAENAKRANIPLPGVMVQLLNRLKEKDGDQKTS